jgi:hypothetical protein
MIVVPRRCGLNREGDRGVAHHKTVTLIDDMSGGKAAETVSFSVDGAQYEIDLSAKNAKALRKVLAPFTDAARHVGPVAIRSSEKRHTSR